MITDVLYRVNLYIRFCGKRFELSHVMDIALQKCYVLLLLLLLCNIDSRSYGQERACLCGSRKQREERHPLKTDGKQTHYERKSPMDMLCAKYA